MSLKPCKNILNIIIKWLTKWTIIERYFEPTSPQIRGVYFGGNPMCGGGVALSLIDEGTTLLVLPVL